MPFNPDRYDAMSYRRCGRSGLRLPAISFGLWQGTGSYVDETASRRIAHAAFDHGITHFDLANNYGNPAGASEELFGRILRGMPRHELVIATKAGYHTESTEGAPATCGHCMRVFWVAPEEAAAWPGCCEACIWNSSQRGM